MNSIKFIYFIISVTFYTLQAYSAAVAEETSQISEPLTKVKVGSYKINDSYGPEFNILIYRKIFTSATIYYLIQKNLYF